MRTLTLIACKAIIAGGLGLMALAPANPALAQYAVNCPVGYAYSYGSGCVPAGGAYSSFYGAPGYGGFPPIYEPFGFAYGGGYGGYRGGYRGGVPGGFHGAVGGFHGGVGGIPGGVGGFHGGVGGFHGGGGGFHGGGGGHR